MQNKSLWKKIKESDSYNKPEPRDCHPNSSDDSHYNTRENYDCNIGYANHSSYDSGSGYDSGGGDCD